MSDNGLLTHASLRGTVLVDSYALGIASVDSDCQDDRSRRVQVLSREATPLFQPGFSGYVFEGFDVPADVRGYITSRTIPAVLCARPVEKICDGDIIEVNHRPGRARVVQSAHSDDFTLLVTNRCNSNCVMCPDSEVTRRNGRDTGPEWIDRYLSLLPRRLRHLTITGGEPTLLRAGLLALLDRCLHTFPECYLLLLSNGRWFACPPYAERLGAIAQGRVTVAIAIHAPSAPLHDAITQVQGSFEQTLAGIARLLAAGVRVEVRVVLQQANVGLLDDIGRLVASRMPGVDHVSFMGLELLGSAALHQRSVWVDPSVLMPELDQAIPTLLRAGIASRIYNLPLCCVEPRYWSLCARSISEYKRAYGAECSACAVRSRCGGIFGTPLNHRLLQLIPISGGGASL